MVLGIFSFACLPSGWSAYSNHLSIFLNWVIYFLLLLSFKCTLYFWIQILYQICFANYFRLVLGLFFNFLNNAFWRPIILNLSPFALWFILFTFNLKKFGLAKGLKYFLLYFWTNIVLDLPFSFMAHSELIFKYSVKGWASIFLICIFSSYRTIYWKN